MKCFRRPEDNGQMEAGWIKPAIGGVIVRLSAVIASAAIVALAFAGLFSLFD